MQVTDIEAIPLEHDLGAGNGLGSSRGTTQTRFTTLVKLTTDDGTVGWGEAFAPPRTAATAVEELLADRVVGMDPREAESLAEWSYTHGYHFGGSAFKQAAVSGVDLACWDLLGKAAGEPVHRMLGGETVEALTPYASTGYVREGDSAVRPHLERAAGDGFTAAKIKIGRGLEDDVERVRTAREVLGEDAHLMVDYNGNYAPKQVLESVRAIREYDLTWVEEPVPAENLSGYRELSRRLDVPLAAGEAHYGRFEFKRLVDDRLVDVVQPNLGRCGGLSEARTIADLATTENVAPVPHVWNSGVGVAAALHFLAAAPDYPHSTHRPVPKLFEFDRSENPLRHEVLEAPFDPTGGSVEVPQGPGLGIEVDEDAVERYRVD